MPKSDGWEWAHERSARILREDGEPMMCEEHVGEEWPHGDCAGPGMPWIVEGRDQVQALVRAAGKEVFDAEG